MLSPRAGGSFSSLDITLCARSFQMPDEKRIIFTNACGGIKAEEYLQVFIPELIPQEHPWQDAAAAISCRAGWDRVGKGSALNTEAATLVLFWKVWLSHRSVPPLLPAAAGCQRMKCTFLCFAFLGYFWFKSSGFFWGRMCPDFKVRSRSAAACAAMSLRKLNGFKTVFFILNLSFCVI